MDDPWGSPWATPDPDPAGSAGKSNNNGRPTSLILDANPEPPPRAFFSASASNLNIPSSQSAWLDDDSFGDWASPEPALTSAAPTGRGIWGTGTGGDFPAFGSGDGQLTPRYEPQRKGGSPQWPSSRATSPGLQPLSKRASTDNISFDPWAAEVSLNNNKKEGLQPVPPLPQVKRLPSLPALSEIEPKPPGLTSQATDVDVNGKSYQPSPQSAPSPSLTPAVEPNHAEAKGTDAGNSSTPELRLEPVASGVTDTPDAKDTQDAALDHSPVTPDNDEDDEYEYETSSGQQGNRKVSKVHDLVVMYDGIAKRSKLKPRLVPPPKQSVSDESLANETTPDEAPRSPPPTPNDESLTVNKKRAPSTAIAEAPILPYSGSEDDAEEEHSEEAQPEFTSTYLGSPEEDLKDEAEPMIERNQYQEDEAAAAAAEDTARPITPTHEPFKVDLSKLDDLLPGVPASNVTGEDVVVPDRVITDSFESTSERKSWYQMSRLGPLRKHNAGEDDENYVRITWASSTIRHEVIRTVRRWMEEDSILGSRPYRGGRLGGIKAASALGFGWDTPSTAVGTAEEEGPVDLGRFFGRKKTPGLASFGSSSLGQNTDAGRGSTDTAHPARLSAPQNGLPLAENTLSAPSVRANESMSKTDTTAEEEDDEDDWGEMVSPSVDQPTHVAAVAGDWDDFSNVNPASKQQEQADPPQAEDKSPETPDAPTSPLSPDMSGHISSAAAKKGDAVPSQTKSAVLAKDVPSKNKKLEQDEAIPTPVPKEGSGPPKALASPPKMASAASKATQLYETAGGDRHSGDDRAVRDAEIARQFVLDLSDLSYMLR